MSTNASLTSNYAHDFLSPRVDYWLLAIISALLHVCAWLWWSRAGIETAAVVPPQVVEILLVTSRPVPPPPVVTPAPPPPTVVPPPVNRSPPKPRPKPIAKPEPEPAPPLVMPPPVPTPIVAAPPPAVIPASPPEPVLVPASTKATSRRKPKPDYPSIAQRRGWEGRVLLAVEVMANGQPGSITVAATSGHDVLDSAAMKTVKRWLFEPARRGNTPVASTMNLSIVFKLEE